MIAITASAMQHKKLVLLGTSTGTLQADQSATLTVMLNSTGKRLLVRRRTLKGKIAFTQSATPVASTTITFKAKPEKD